MSFPVGVATLPIGPVGRVSVFNGLIDGLNSHTTYPKQAWELEQWLGSAAVAGGSWARAATSGPPSAASTRSS